MLSRPLSSGWKPAPSSSSAATRPCTVTRPRVGVSKRVASLSSVLLPEPLAPMTPSASPGATAKVTSRSAQNSSRQPRRWKVGQDMACRERARSWCDREAFRRRRRSEWRACGWERPRRATGWRAWASPPAGDLVHGGRRRRHGGRLRGRRIEARRALGARRIRRTTWRARGTRGRGRVASRRSSGRVGCWRGCGTSRPSPRRARCQCLHSGCLRRCLPAPWAECRR